MTERIGEEGAERQREAPPALLAPDGHPLRDRLGGPRLFAWARHVGIRTLRGAARARRVSERGDAPRRHGTCQDRPVRAGKNLRGFVLTLCGTRRDRRGGTTAGSGSAPLDAPCALG